MKATIVEGNGYSQKDKNKANTDKTKHGNEKSVKSQSQSQSQRRSRIRRNLKWANPYPLNGVGWLEADLDTKKLPLFKQRVLVTMVITYWAQLLQAPTEGYEDAIIVLVITVDNFELKHGLLTLVQNKLFFVHDKEDPWNG
ncbi:hypothetical protein Tco_0053811 [Tanacetum coccineum]